MWRSDTDRQEAAQHARQVRSVTRVMLPMIDVASLVERMPEAKHERLVHAMAEHQVSAGERAPAVMTRLATWVAAHVAGVLRQHESPEAAGRR